MATNWVKSGLDSYLALTGEHRAEKKAEADLETQNQNLMLAKNQDARAATSAGLQNQESELRIGEMKRKTGDIANTDKLIQDFITMKTASDPSIPNSIDPNEIGVARQTATDLAHTAALLNGMPEGAAELNLDSLPIAAKNVLMEGPGKAAMFRKGSVHKDPATGMEYTMTGELGPVRILKEKGQPTRVIPTMLAVKPDGTTFEVPYTENQSNSPEDPVKYVTPEMLNHRAGATLTAIKQAEELGISPSVAYSQGIYKMVSALPYEQKVAWLQTEIAKETGRRDKYTADAEIVKAAEPFSKRLEALKGTPDEKRTEAAAIMLTAPSAVVEHLLKTSKSVHEMFPDNKKAFTTVETEEGVFSFDGSTGTKGKRLGSAKKAKGGTGDSSELPAEAKMIEYMVNGGIAPNKSAAYKLLKTSKESPKELIAKLVMNSRKSQEDQFLKPGSPGYKTDKQLLDDAKSLVTQMSSLPDEEETGADKKPPAMPPPGKKPLSAFAGGGGSTDTPLSKRFGLTF